MSLSARAIIFVVDLKAIWDLWHARFRVMSEINFDDFFEPEEGDAVLDL